MGETKSGERHFLKIHSKNRESILTTTPNSGGVNLRGIVNCMGLFLIVSNLNIIIHNFEVYGILSLASIVDLRSLSRNNYYDLSFSFICFFAFIIVAFALEKAEERLAALKPPKKPNNATWSFIDFSLLFAYVATVSWHIYHCQVLFIIAFAAEFLFLTMFLKMWSFFYFRHKKRFNPDKDNEELEDLGLTKSATLRQYVYFLFAPTLCYQPFYPRVKTIRICYCLKKAFEIVFCLATTAFIITQYVAPHSFFKISSNNPFEIVFSCLLRILKFSFPTTCAWLLMTFAFFQSYLNLIAEIMGFGDRLFYEDWWNCKDLAEYWRKWNLPVHNWIIIHIYSPLARRKFSRNFCTVAVFLFSAIFHELIMVVSLKTFCCPYSFLGMMIQIPMISLSQKMSKYFKEPWTNISFWVSFCLVGNPTIVLLYCRLYIEMNPYSFHHTAEIFRMK